MTGHRLAPTCAASFAVRDLDATVTVLAAELCVFHVKAAENRGWSWGTLGGWDG